MGHQSGQNPRPVDQPAHTILVQGRVNLIQPFITRYQGSHEGQQDGEARNHEIERPLPTVDTSNRYALVEPLIMEYYGNGGVKPVSEPLGTVTTKDRFATVEPFVLNTGHSNAAGSRVRSIKEPLSTVVTKAEHCLVEPVLSFDIRFRMLKNHELKKAQGFPEDYILTGNITEQIKQIGNAVPVNTAKALTIAAMMSA